MQRSRELKVVKSSILHWNRSKEQFKKHSSENCVLPVDVGVRIVLAYHLPADSAPEGGKIVLDASEHTPSSLAVHY